MVYTDFQFAGSTLLLNTLRVLMETEGSLLLEDVGTEHIHGGSRTVHKVLNPIEVRPRRGLVVLHYSSGRKQMVHHVHTQREGRRKS